MKAILTLVFLVTLFRSCPKKSDQKQAQQKTQNAGIVAGKK